jgi:hypothetical protein
VFLSLLIIREAARLLQRYGLSFSLILGAPQLGLSCLRRTICASTWNGNWLAWR